MPTELLPEKFYGRHVESHEDLIEMAHETLRQQTSVPHNRRIDFENAGEMRVYEDSADAKLALLVPLPYLDFADVTTQELQDALAPTMPAGVRFEVDVAPAPDT